MYSTTFQLCASLTAILFIRCAFGEESHDKIITDYQCTFNPNGYHSTNHLKTVKNCEAQLKLEKIHLKCEAYASSAMELTQFTNSTAGLLVTDFMETFEDIDDILTLSSNYSCLKYVASRIQKMNFLEWEIASKFNGYTCKIPKETFIPIMLILLMDMQVNFTDDYALGIVHWNKTCLRMANDVSFNQTDANNSFDVSSCVTNMEVIRRFLPSVSNFRLMAGITMTDLFTKDFLSVILVLMRELFFIGYGYSVSSIAFKTGLFKYLPTEGLTFLSHRNVSNVEFQGNGILSIRNDDIPVIESLLTLDLSNCQIEFIEPRAFDGLVYLQRLDLHGNRLKELSHAFSVLHNLETLNLRDNRGDSKNEFQYRSLAIDEKSNLRSLDFGNMVLINFWENLGNLSKLENLNLSNCSLKYVPTTDIAYLLPNLLHLNLSHNNLHNLSAFALSGLNKLQYLDLSWNWLTNIQYNAVIDVLPKLKLISLKANRICRFSTLNLSSDSALDILDLSWNKIQSWKESTVNSNNTALKVNLIGNNITEVNSQMLSDFISFNQIQLSENPFDCKSCLLKDFVAWLKRTNTSTDFFTSPYTCFFPKEDFKKSITNVTLELCIEEVFDWVGSVIIPAVAVATFLISISITFFIYRWHFIYFVYLIRSKVQKHVRRNTGIVFKYDAFVSYCSDDRDWVVGHLIPAVENQDPKLHLCVHERDFEAGETIMNNIIECIDNSHKSIFILSQRFIQSQWCQWELQMARHKLFEDKRDVLILIMLSQINEKEIPKILKHLISKRTYLQWPENEYGQKIFWTRLKDAIGKCQCLPK